MPKQNSVQIFDSRYIDKSRLETLLKALYDGSEYSVRRQLDKWRVEAPEPLERVCIIITVAFINQRTSMLTLIEAD